MIEKLFKKLIRGRRGRPFSAWQIELTTRCPLRCKMCIRTECDDWQFQDMSLEDFKRTLPYLQDVNTVILEGWGESLLHKNLPECIRLAKGEGTEVGFVTSGMGLTRDRVNELIEAGVDFVGFSISGTTTKTHDAIRVNSHLPEVLNAIGLFNEHKAQRRLDRPRLHLVFLMVKDNILEVPGVPAFAREVGIDEVVLINICHAINTWQEKQRVFVWESDQNEYEEILKQATVRAKRLKVRLNTPSLRAVDVPICSENPLKNLYISATGEVSPCVYLFPPLPSPYKRIFCGKEQSAEKISFGNIFGEPFETIWNREGYQRFRNCFAERKKKFEDLYASLWGNPRVKSVQESALPEPPQLCKTCHKIIGV